MSESHYTKYTRMIYKVHNLHNGSRTVPTGYTSWLDYWVKSTKQPASFCHRVDCVADGFALASDGAHVQLDDANDNYWYIVPLCHKCNTQFGDSFQVLGPLVRVTDPTYILP